MKAQKAVFLVFLALGGPVLVFLFLKTFGTNEFRVTPLHVTAPVYAPDGCPYAYAAPYRVPDSVTNALGMNTSDSLFVVYFDSTDVAAMNRVRTEFDEAPVDFVTPDRIAGQFDPGWLRRCALLMRGDTAVALLDRHNRIRGNYYGPNRDEIDRLVVEMKIILKMY